MISSQLVSQLAFLQASIAAADPIAEASPITKAALLLAGQQMVVSIDVALREVGVLLDAGDPSGFPDALVIAMVRLGSAAADQSSLAEMSAFVGRAVFNLAQA